MADFFERTETLAQMVGDGDLVGHFSVNKIYAVNQHEQGWLNFMGRYGPKKIRRYHNGGGPKFVEAPLLANFEGYYENLGDAVLKGTLPEAMRENLEDQDDNLQWAAPEDSGDLKDSGAYSVIDDGSVVFSKLSSVPYERE